MMNIRVMCLIIISVVWHVTASFIEMCVYHRIFLKSYVSRWNDLVLKDYGYKVEKNEGTHLTKILHVYRKPLALTFYFIHKYNALCHSGICCYQYKIRNGRLCTKIILWLILFVQIIEINFFFHHFIEGIFWIWLYRENDIGNISMGGWQ